MSTQIHLFRRQGIIRTFAFLIFFFNFTHIEAGLAKPEDSFTGAWSESDHSYLLVKEIKDSTFIQGMDKESTWQAVCIRQKQSNQLDCNGKGKQYDGKAFYLHSQLELSDGKLHEIWQAFQKKK